jgi:serine-type D-Ala-D-Ala carboxypeptidase (penicillin-binding protein 5/6)
MKQLLQRGTKLLSSLCLLITLSMTHAHASNETPPQPPQNLTAKGAVLVDMQSGQVLFDQNKDAKLYPASITKIMTCILALEHGKLTDMVTTSQLARDQEGNRVYLEPGEQQPLEKMLYGLMLNSGNDAAVAIAEHFGGSVEKFADMMNRKAAELHMTHTHFVTPNGLHDDNHFTTPYDMALLSAYAMKNPKFRQIVATENYEWHGQAWDSNLVNINPMLWNYDGATGVKTGFTDQAQQTMVASAKRGDREVMAVLMGVMLKQTIREEATQLLDYGFAAFNTEKLASSGDMLTSFEQSGDKVDALLARDVYGTIKTAGPGKTDRVLHVSAPTAPYAKGTKVGTVDFTVDGVTVATVDLLSGRDVFPPVPTAASVAQDHLPLLTAALLAVIFALLLVGRTLRQRKTSGGNSQPFDAPPSAE